MGTPKKKWTEEQLRKAVAESQSIRATAIALGLTPYGSTYATVKKYLKLYGIDTSHFTGKGHGKTTPKQPEIPTEQLLVRGSLAQRCTVRRHILRHSLLPYRCSLCAANTWLEKPLSLVLDHINGVNNDHRLENLRWLCPNCNSQQDTFAGRNKRK
jgi:hypothetical protein